MVFKSSVLILLVLSSAAAQNSLNGNNNVARARMADYKRTMVQRPVAGSRPVIPKQGRPMERPTMPEMPVTRPVIPKQGMFEMIKKMVKKDDSEKAMEASHEMIKKMMKSGDNEKAMEGTFEMIKKMMKSGDSEKAMEASHEMMKKMMKMGDNDKAREIIRLLRMGNGDEAASKIVGRMHKGHSIRRRERNSNGGFLRSSMVRKYSEYKRKHSISKKLMDYEDESTCPQARKWPKRGLTKSWVKQQSFVMNKDLFDAKAFEVDMFQDLAWRAPCKKPTEVKVTMVCRLARGSRRISKADAADASKCTKDPSTRMAGVLQAMEHDGEIITEYKVGATNHIDAALMKEKMEEAMKDTDSDVEGVASFYQMKPATEPSIDSDDNNDEPKEDSGRTGKIASIIGAAAAALGVAACFAGFLVNRNRKTTVEGSEMEVPLGQSDSINSPGAAPELVEVAI